MLAPSQHATRFINIFDQLSHRHLDYADLYFQLSQDENWVLEDSIIKEGGFHIDRGVELLRAVSGEKTGFAYSDQITLRRITTMRQCSQSYRSNQTGNIITPNAFNPVAPILRYQAINPLDGLTKEKKLNCYI